MAKPNEKVDVKTNKDAIIAQMQRVCSEQQDRVLALALAEDIKGLDEARKKLNEMTIAYTRFINGRVGKPGDHNQNNANQKNDEPNFKLSLAETVDVLYAQIIQNPVFFKELDDDIDRLKAEVEKDKMQQDKKNNHDTTLQYQKTIRDGKEKSIKKFLREILIAGGPENYMNLDENSELKLLIIDEINKCQVSKDFWDPTFKIYK